MNPKDTCLAPIQAPVFNSLTDNLNSGEAGDEVNSDVVDAVLAANPSLQGLAKGKNFQGLYDLCVTLNALGYNNKEYQCLSSYFKLFPVNDNIDIQLYLNYLNKYYYQPVLQLLAGSQYGKAHLLMYQMLKRVNLLNGHPYYKYSPVNLYSINRVYLTYFLLQDPVQCYKYADELSLLMPKDTAVLMIDTLQEGIARKQIHLLNLDSVSVQGTPTSFPFYRLYWKGLLALRDARFGAATLCYDSILVSSHDGYILSLASVMKARCLFWNYKRNHGPVTRVKAQILSLDSFCVIPGLKQDIREYASLLNARWTPDREKSNPKKQIDPDLSDRDELKEEIKTEIIREIIEALKKLK